MSLSVSRNRSLNIFGAWRARPVDDFLVVRFFAFLAIHPPVEVNGKAPPSSILGRSRLCAAKGSQYATQCGLTRPFVRIVLPLSRFRRAIEACALAATEVTGLHDAVDEGAAEHERADEPEPKHLARGVAQQHANSAVAHR